MKVQKSLGLDVKQTEILYNFQFLKTIEDIKNEKDENRKNKRLNGYKNGKKVLSQFLKEHTKNILVSG